MNTFQNNLKSFCTSTVAKTKKQKTLTAIVTFELNYFNCDMQIATRDEESWKGNQPPPFRCTSSKEYILYKLVKCHFQERKNATLCIKSFNFPILNKDLCISVCPM